SNAKAIGNWVMGDLFRALKDRKLDEQLYINNWPVSPGNLAALVRLIDQGVISGKMAKSLFEETLASGRPPQEIVKERGLEQVSDSASIGKAIERV
ncbi:MAG: Asp-tRNA(Asn)/Glu-tRNA(Gln) amidotransferase GatCAB subunit B, partial [Deltaproteobacteria bacterium]